MGCGARRSAAILIAAIALSSGPGCGGSDAPPTSPSPMPGPGQTVSYTALGASDAVGVGASVPCFPFAPCPLPNFAGGPFAAGFPLLAKQGLQEISVGMSTQVINRLTSQGVSVIDLLCDPGMYDESSYSSDGFHPSDSGYAIMADGMLDAITTGSHPNPRSSCPEMTLVPPP